MLEVNDHLHVCPYDIDKLARLLYPDEQARKYLQATKCHLHYFETYFAKLNARTIVIENEYIDRDFLEDHAAYYDRCFFEYGKHCKRLHFFTSHFDLTKLTSWLSNDIEATETEQLKASYLGFIVFKPVPETVIGKTCLRVYDSDGGRREYPITRTYDVNLFGIFLHVKTLAFQEQDRTAAACATSALWSVFQGTGKLFHHPIPSPVDITRMAGASISSIQRLFPSEGLTLEQIARAIREVGLEPYYVRIQSREELTFNVYSYLMNEIPLLMGMYLFEDRKRGCLLPANERKRMPEGHAVAVTGVSIGFPAPDKPSYNSILLKSSRIDKLYAHDDQVGPFARMKFVTPPNATASGFDKDGYNRELALSTSWPSRFGSDGIVHALPSVLIVPLYHKIRIPVHIILEMTKAFEGILKRLVIHGVLPSLGIMEWDVKLTKVNSLKSEIHESTVLDRSDRLCILTDRMPRYIWRASLHCSSYAGAIVLDLLFDTTDIIHGSIFIRPIYYDRAMGQYLHAIRDKLISLGFAWSLRELKMLKNL